MPSADFCLITHRVASVRAIGLHHAVQKHENGGDAVEAIFEGAGVAIEGTARALVGAAEMGYKILSSKPSRFVGRMLLKGAKKLDDKIMAEAKRK